MAIFNKNTLTQVSGFNNPIIAGELVWDQATFWNLVITAADNVTPVDLTGATIDAQIIRREVSNITDTRYGLQFDIADYSPSPTPVALTVSNVNDTAGTFTLVIDSSTWGLMSNDPELEINAADCVGYSGRIKISFPASGSVPANDYIIFLLFLVRSDGIIVE